jgi:hypothetical protein
MEAPANSSLAAPMAACLNCHPEAPAARAAGIT